MKTIIDKIFLIILLVSSLCYSQIDSTTINNDLAEPQDTLFIMQKSPWGAVLRSAILPGWGQYYNESYYKIPVVLGISGWFVYNYLSNDDLYKQYKILYVNTPVQRYKEYREFYRDQRDLFAIYYFLAFFANLVDAYVDAHLFDFTVTEDFLHKSPMLNLRFNF